MKVILQRDVKGMGRAHEAVETKDGYALNYLIPQKLAISATPSAAKEAEGRLAKVASRKELETKLVTETITALAGTTVTITKKANEKGHLYDAVGAKEIAEAAKLPEEAITLPKPIKELGTFRVPVALGDSFGEFSVEVVAE